MKTLNRVLLVNWHYFQKQIIDFGNVNFLTGNNTAGKSTIIDALQVVLLGETRSSSFNRAANKKAYRTLESYLIGSMGEDIKGGNKSLRGNRNFSTYIVAEIYDDQKNEYFCLGAAFDYFVDKDYSTKYFYLKNTIPENCFIENNIAMDTSRLTDYFKSHYQGKYEFESSATGYRERLIKFKLNVQDTKFFRMMKKAISFEPINDIEGFITENICDIEDNLDITEMRENINNYIRQEEIADEFEKKLIALQEINNKFADVDAHSKMLEKQQFMIDHAHIGIEEEHLLKLEHNAKECDRKIEEYTDKIKEIERQLEQCNQKSADLNKEKNNFCNENHIEQIESNIAALQSRISGIENTLVKFANGLRHNSDIWRRYVDAVRNLEFTDEIKRAAERLLSELKRLSEIRAENVTEFSAEFLRGISGQFAELKNLIRPKYDELCSAIKENRDREKELRERIEALNKGIKPYKDKAVDLKNAMSTELKKRFGEDVRVDFFADLIDISDENWHNAVEGYLNTQRMNLIIEPKYFDEAYRIYKRIRHTVKAYEYRVVDCEKVYNASKIIVAHNLSEVIVSENKYAKAYADYLMGNVVRCDDESRLREYKKAVTRECMFYMGYTFGSYNKEIYDNPYIGGNSLKKQLENAKSELTLVEAQIKKLQPQKDTLDKLNNDWFLSENYIAETCESHFDNANRLPELKTELDVQNKIHNSIDFGFLHDIEQAIDETQMQIDELGKDKDRITEARGGENAQKERLINEDIPKKKEDIQRLRDALAMSFSDETINKFSGEYSSALEQYRTHSAVREHFTQEYDKTSKRNESLKKELIELKSAYIRDQQVSFAVSTDSNQDFEKEYSKIKDTELPKYRELIVKARDDAMERFRNDFLNQLKDNIRATYDAINDINYALRRTNFGNDKYQFKADPNPAYFDYYNMIMDDLSAEEGTLFTKDFMDKYGTTMQSLFDQISGSAENEGTSKSVELFSSYKTYLTFDLRVTDINGKTESLSKSISSKSGGETQTPFYIAVLASFVQLYKVNDTTSLGNTFRLVIFDEAFSNMDADRIEESIKLIRDLELQGIICSPTKNAEDIAPYVDNTLFVSKISHNGGYRSGVMKWTKEMGDIADELSDEDIDDVDQ